MSSFDPTDESIAAVTDWLAGLAARIYGGAPTAPTVAADSGGTAAMLAAARPGRGARPLLELLEELEGAATLGVDTTNPGYLAYIPGGGLWASAVGDLLAGVTNRYVALPGLAPALVAIERSVIDWACALFDLPAGAAGVLTSGGSIANLTAVVAARAEVLGDRFDDGRIYVGAHCHRSVAKAAKIAGLTADAIRIVPSTAMYTIDPDALGAMIDDDRRAGHRPCLVVGSAGTTDTGAVDPLSDLARIARNADAWFHVDAAYGGFFALTDRGRTLFRGIEEADSITLDPHKSLFLPYGTGCLLTRDPSRVRGALSVEGDYLQDLAADREASFADLSPELTREARGLRLWLALHHHGIDAFTTALDERLDLAVELAAALEAHPAIEVVVPPVLSTVVFRLAGDRDDECRSWLEAINGSGRIFCSSTRLGGRITLRACVLSHRTDRARIAEAVDIITAAVP